jgi:tellurite resistance protein TerC
MSGDALLVDAAPAESDRPSFPFTPLWIRLFRWALALLIPAGLIALFLLSWRQMSRMPEKVLRGHQGGVMALAYAPDGSLLATGGQDGRITLWDPHSGSERATFDAHQRRVAALAFSPDQALLASGSFDHTIKLWDAREQRLRETLRPEHGQVHALAFSPNGRFLAAALDGDYPTETGPWTGQSIVLIHDLVAGKEFRRLPCTNGWFVSLCFSADGRLLAAGAREPIMAAAPGEAWLWDTDSWQEQLVVPHQAGVLTVCFLAEGRTLAVAGWLRQVKLHDLPSGKERQSLPPQGRCIHSTAVSPDGRLLASGSNDRSVRLWDLENDRERSRIPAHSGWVMALAFSPNGAQLASAGQEGVVKLWAVANQGADPVAGFMNWIKNPMVWAWIGFHVFIIFMLAIDLGVFNREAHTMRMREAAGWYTVWVLCAVVFGVGVWYFQGNQKGLEFASGYLIEQSLSVDNLFVFLVIFRYFAVPPQLQHRVLFWGIIGALIMRAVFILVGAALLERFVILMWVFGAFLVYTGYKLLGSHAEVHPEHNPVLRLARRWLRISPTYESAKFFVRKQGQLFATPLFLVLLVIESTDVVFAIDSIPAILAVFVPDPPDIFIAYTSNIFAILGLRSLFFLLSGFLGMFRYLNIGLALVLAFVGIKMLISHKPVDWPQFWHMEPWIKIPIHYSLAVIASILAIAVLASVAAASKGSGAKEPPVPPAPDGVPPAGGPSFSDGEAGPAPGAETRQPPKHH